MTTEEIKVRLFEAIAANSQNLCDSAHYLAPTSIAKNVNAVYDILFNENKE